jgi:hypothetical protein
MHYKAGALASKHEATSYRIVPDNDVFDGASAYFVQIDERKPKRAAIKALKREGMRSAKVVSMSEVDRKALQSIDPDKKATVFAIMLEGKIDGRPARAIGYVWYGSAGHAEGEPSNSGVSMFQAPTPAFEALGGMAIPGVLWLGGTCKEDENMLEDGRLPPKQATKKLAVFFNSWMVNYVTNQMAMTMMMGQTMAIQQQTLSNMQSYNNAMAACGGAGDCMVMGADGSWTADVQ